jgi:hypothetical protein
VLLAVQRGLLQLDAQTPADHPFTRYVPSWKALAEHYNKIKAVHMRDLFHQDPQRFADLLLQSERIVARNWKKI